MTGPAEQPTGHPEDVGADPMHPHPQDAHDGEEREPGQVEDDSPVERYRDSPGLAASRPLTEEGEVAEPNEPG